MTIGRFNDYYFGIESSVAPVSAAMRCTANHTGPVPRRRSRPKWSRDPRVLDPGPVWGNSHGQSWEMNCTPTVKNDRSDSGTWGCPLRVEMDVFSLPREKDSRNEESAPAVHMPLELGPEGMQSNATSQRSFGVSLCYRTFCQPVVDRALCCAKPPSSKASACLDEIFATSTSPSTAQIVLTAHLRHHPRALAGLTGGR